MVALNWSMPHIYGTNTGDVWWAASDVGWVVGASYIAYAPLLRGATTVLYEGKPVGTPDAGAFWRVIQDHGVKHMFAAPTALRAVKKEDPEGQLHAKYNLEHFEGLFLAGERSDPATVRWAEQLLKVHHTWFILFISCFHRLSGGECCFQCRTNYLRLAGSNRSDPQLNCPSDEAYHWLVVMLATVN